MHEPLSTRTTLQGDGPVVDDARRLGTLRLPTSSRTRRNHGVFLVGDELATVYSSRRDAAGFGVSMSIGAGALVLNGSMTAPQARAMARALVAAADAADALKAGGGA